MPLIPPGKMLVVQLRLKRHLCRKNGRDVYFVYWDQRYDSVTAVMNRRLLTATLGTLVAKSQNRGLKVPNVDQICDLMDAELDQLLSRSDRWPTPL